MTGPHALPAALRGYVLATALTGPAVAVALVLSDPPAWDLRVAVMAVALAVLALVAERFPLHLTHKTNVNVATVAYVAMILLLPVSLPALLALVAVAIAQILRHVDREEGIFNTAQTGLYVAAGAWSYHALRDGLLAALPGAVAGVVALVLSAVAMHVVNTGLVAGAVSLQLQASAVRVWLRTFALDLPAQVVLVIIGIVAAHLARAEPLALVLPVLPMALVYHALRQSVRLRRDTQAALATLVDIIELRDPYTAGHSRRVAALARELALRIGVTGEEADLVELAGQVHDLGKVAVDTDVLRKPGRLDEDEWQQVRFHPVHSADVVARFSAYDDEVVAMVRHHHERWDGKGYPDGLAGEEIPLGARILAVADTFDALTSDRPYRQGMAIEQALAILESGAGKQWDPHLVETFVAGVRERHFTIPEVLPHMPLPGSVGRGRTVRAVADA